MTNEKTFVAFRDFHIVARGTIDVIVAALHPLSSAEQAGLRLLDEATGRTIDLDWRGNADEAVARAKAQLVSKSKGRPKLGVESREITLLPRHWTWLDGQGRSASATLRALIDQCAGQGTHSRAEIDAIYWQMSTLAGDLPGFEEATRRLYAADWDEVGEILQGWPGDLPGYLVERLHAVTGSVRADENAHDA